MWRPRFGMRNTVDPRQDHDWQDALSPACRRLPRQVSTLHDKSLPRTRSLRLARQVSASHEKSPPHTRSLCLWGPCVVRGPVDGRFLVWWVIDNVVWTDSWLSIAGAGAAWLVLVQVKNKRERRRRWGLQVWRRQVGFVRGTRWPAESSAGRMVAWTARWSRGRFLGRASKPRSSQDYMGAKSRVEIGRGYTEFAGFAVVH
jgi:hypothetical protein